MTRWKISGSVVDVFYSHIMYLYAARTQKPEEYLEEGCSFAYNIFFTQFPYNDKETCSIGNVVFLVTNNFLPLTDIFSNDSIHKYERVRICGVTK